MESYLIQVNCKNCAAPLPNAEEHSKCNYCGSDFRIIKKHSYQLNKYTYGGEIKTKKDFKWKELPRATKFIIILMVIFFPFLMLNYKFK